MRFRINHLIAAVAGVIMTVTLAGCRTPATVEFHRFVFQQPHMGTLFTITLYAPDEGSARTAGNEAFARIAALDRTLSDYDSESELMQLCRKPVGQPVPVSADLFRVLQRGQQLAELSDGAFDVTLGPVVRQWRRARRQAELPPPDALTRARRSVGWQQLKLDTRTQTATLLLTNMQLDLGGIAKGFAADAALGELKARGCPSALVAASGDIAAGDAPPGQRGWRVSIGAPVSDPARANESVKPARSETGAPFARTLLLRNSAVSTSGDAEQFVEIQGVRYSHIVDPKTGVGLTNHLQVTVVARHAMDTDAMATTICVLGSERGMKLVDSQPGMAALILWPTNGGLASLESLRMRTVPVAK